MKIAMISTADNANSGHNICEAVRRYSNHEIRTIVFAPHPFGYKRDIELTTQAKYLEAKSIIDTADILHFKGDQPPSDIWKRLNGHVIKNEWNRRGYGRFPMDHKIIITSPAGNHFRRNISPTNDYNARAYDPAYAYAKWGFCRYIHDADLRTVLTADLNYPEYDGIYTQQTIDTEVQPQWSWKSGDKIIIAHSPSIRSNKGTDDLFLPAIEILKKRYDIEVDMIEDMSFKEANKRRSRATLYFDQCSVGFYGNALLETARYGVPCAAWISDHAIAQSDGKIGDQIPIINFHPTVEGVVASFDKVLSSDLNELSQRTLNWVRDFHGYKTVGSMWDYLYTETARKKRKTVRGRTGR